MGSGLQGRFLDRLEVLAARQTEAGVATCIDALHAVTQGLVDVCQRGEAGTSVAEAYIAHQDFTKIQAYVTERVTPNKKKKKKKMYCQQHMGGRRGENNGCGWRQQDEQG